MVLLATGCSVSGSAEPAPDYTPLMVPADSFPAGPATPVPAPQVAGAVSDITLRPSTGDVNPPECTPAAVDTATAVVLVGPGPAQSSTLTEMVVRSPESLQALASAVRGCPEFRGGPTGQQEIRSELTDELRADGDVTTLALVRTLRSPGSDTVTTVAQWVAQRGDVRLVVQLRMLGTPSDTDNAATADFFATAVAHAFGGKP
ncbi:hypothetical protein GCM10023217_05790 [Gordonia alkaliphila]|uniref:Sensor domain-containing protein n=1 Tax=Gordonia alkaliphila TaxID=1053547 RepID=A0ABP8YV49_9ACTN